MILNNILWFFSKILFRMKLNQIKITKILNNIFKIVNTFRDNESV